MNKELKQLNFKDLLILDDKIDINNYCFSEYLKNHKHLVKGYCLRCETKGCNFCETDKEFKLSNISHGASTSDILEATGYENYDFSEWHNEGVMFIMESPSVDGWGLYDEIEFNGYQKNPAKLWYWVHHKQEKYNYPQEFKGATYGTLFNSIIFTFQLKNAYLTNLVKCGLNNSQGNYKGIDNYPYESITTCYEHFLSKEIESISPKVIFCFGSRVYDLLWDLYPDDYPFAVVALPHPAGRRRGFKDEFYRHLYFSMILEGLFRAGIVSKTEAGKIYGTFIH